MDQFNDDVMQDLMADSPASPPGAAFDNIDGLDDFEGDGFDEGAMDDMALYDSPTNFSDESYSDGYDSDYGDEGEAWDLLEEAMADSLDAYDDDEFLASVLGGVGRAASAVRHGARTVGRVSRQVSRVAQRAGQFAGQAQRVAGQAQRLAQRASQARSPAGYLLQRLGQYLNQGFDDYDALEDLADVFAEEDFDDFLPVLGGLAARTLIRPNLRRLAGQLTPALRRRLISSARQAAQNLLRQRGPQGLRSLPRIAQSIANTAARRGLPANALPNAIRQVAARVASQPNLARQLVARPAMTGMAPRPRPTGASRGMARRPQQFY